MNSLGQLDVESILINKYNEGEDFDLDNLYFDIDNLLLDNLL